MERVADEATVIGIRSLVAGRVHNVVLATTSNEARLVCSFDAPLMWLIASFVAALALLSSTWTYLYYQRDGREKRRRALQDFESARRQAEKLQEKICSLARENSYHEEPILDELAFKDVAAKLEQSIEHLYTTENRQTLQSAEVQSREFAALVGRVERERLFIQQVEEILENYFEGSKRELS